MEAAFLAQGDGGEDLLEQASEERVALVRVVMVAQKAREAASEADPVRQEALREEGLKLFNAVVGHAGGVKVAGRVERLKAKG
jgi:methylmalonyl-CoA mutase cobalamin-binding subunit